MILLILLDLLTTVAAQGCPYLLSGGTTLRFEQAVAKHPSLRQLLQAPEAPNKPARRALSSDLPAGSCTYTSAWTQSVSCDEYYGEYDAATANTSCIQTGKLSPSFTVGVPCDMREDEWMGTCVYQGGTAYEVHTVLTGTASACSASKMGCETFGGGKFYGTSMCPDAPSVTQLESNSSGVSNSSTASTCEKMVGLGGSAHMDRSSGWEATCPYNGSAEYARFAWPLEWDASFEEHHPTEGYVIGGHIWYDKRANVKRQDQWLLHGDPDKIAFYGGLSIVTTISKNGKWYRIDRATGNCSFMTLPVGGLRPDWHLDDCCGAAQRSQFMGREYYEHRGEFIRAVRFRKSELDPHFVQITMSDPKDPSVRSLPLKMDIPAGAAVGGDFVKVFFNHSYLEDDREVLFGESSASQFDITGRYECQPFTYSEKEAAKFDMNASTYLQYTEEEKARGVQVATQDGLGTSSVPAQQVKMVSTDPPVTVEWEAVSSSTVRFTVLVTSTSIPPGYVALAFVDDGGMGMSPADSVIGCLGAGGPGTVSTFRITSMSRSGVQPDASQSIEEAAISLQGSTVKMSFLRQLDNGGEVILADGRNSMNWAIGNVCDNASVGYHHQDKGNFQVYLDMGMTNGSSAAAFADNTSAMHEWAAESGCQRALQGAAEEIYALRTLTSDAETATEDEETKTDRILFLTEVGLGIIGTILIIVVINTALAIHFGRAPYQAAKADSATSVLAEQPPQIVATRNPMADDHDIQWPQTA